MEVNKPKNNTILPSEVRFDNKLNDSEKVMYVEIAALSALHGYCFAANKHFSKLYNCHVNTISRRIKALEKYGYIKVEITRDEKTKNIQGKYILRRTLYKKP